MEFTKQQIKRLERLARIEKNPTLEIVDELSKVKDVLKKVKEKEVIFPEQREEISISNPDDIKNDIIDAIRQVKVIVEKYIASKMAVDAQKEAKMSKHTSEKEKSLGELKIAIIEAIQNLAENIPDSLDYSDQFEAILTELKKDNQEKVVSQLKELSKDIKSVSFPEELTEYDRVKVSLSSSQIKELGKAMSFSVSAGGGFPEKSQTDLNNISAKLDPATDIETQDLITVGTTAVEITFANTKGVVVLCAADTNSGNIFIGKSDVENDGDKAFAVLSPGQTRAFTYDKSVNPLYAISSSSGQKLSASLKLDYGAVTFDGFDSRVVLNLLAINSHASDILGQFINPNYVNKNNIILTGGTDFIVDNNAFGPHKVRKSSNEGTDAINAGGDWYGCSGRDLDAGGGVVSVDISRQNLDHNFRALESVKFIIHNNVATPETGVVKITVIGWDEQVGGYVPKAITYLDIRETKLTDKDTYICGMTPTVIKWNKDDSRYGHILFEDAGGTLSSSGTTIEVLLEDYSFNRAQ